MKSDFCCKNSTLLIIYTSTLLIILSVLRNAPADAELPSIVINEKDGSEMILIQVGKFFMGSAPEAISLLLEKDAKISAGFFRAEHPQHPVILDAFYIDRYKVTNAQYQAFMKATGHPAPKYWTDAPEMGSEISFPVGSQNPKHPVVGISWYDAVAYCEWAGVRLPTEAEWEKAARGRLVNQSYPWGDKLSREYANYGGVGGQDKWQWTAPVGSFPANGYGLFDIAGNAFEWCSDWFAEDFYHHSPERNPTGSETGRTRVLRGGSWNNNLFGKYQMRCAYRFHARPETRNLVIGFRCAVDAPRPR